MRLVTGRIIRKQRTRTLSFPATPSSLLLEMWITEKEKASQQTQTKLEVRKASLLPLLDSQWFWDPRKSPCVSGMSSFLGGKSRRFERHPGRYAHHLLLSIRRMQTKKLSELTVYLHFQLSNITLEELIED